MPVRGASYGVPRGSYVRRFRSLRRLFQAVCEDKIVPRELPYLPACQSGFFFLDNRGSGCDYFPPGGRPSACRPRLGLPFRHRASSRNGSRPDRGCRPSRLPAGDGAVEPNLADRLRLMTSDPISPAMPGWHCSSSACARPFSYAQAWSTRERTPAGWSSAKPINFPG